MSTPEEIITDSEIDRVHGNANFGEGITKRQVVASAVLKCASGWHQGHTSQTIAEEHGLIDAKYRLTKKGKLYLWASFSRGSAFEV